MSEHKIPIPSMIYNAAVGGHVTNSQQIIDENLNREQNDINQETVGAVLYNSTNPNGMGRIVLKKNDNFKQVVEAQTYGNTIFIIKYDFTLTGNVTIPVNCVLEFDGGSIRGEYTITGNNTGIKAGLVKIFNINITLAGTWHIAEAYPEWFGAKGDGVTNDTLSFRKCINSFNNIRVNKGNYIITGQTYDSTFEYNNIDGLLINKSNITITFEKEAKLIKETHSQEGKNWFILCINGRANNNRIENITIIGGEFIGDRASYSTTTTEENASAIRCTNANNIVFKDCIITDNQGGAITFYECNNITVDNVICKRNARGAIEVASTQKGIITNSFFSDNGGDVIYNRITHPAKLPGSQICLENDAHQDITTKDIIISNNTIILDNCYKGIEVATGHDINNIHIKNNNLRYNVATITCNSPIMITGNGGIVSKVIIEGNTYENDLSVRNLSETVHFCSLTCKVDDILVVGNIVKNACVVRLANSDNITYAESHISGNISIVENHVVYRELIEYYFPVVNKVVVKGNTLIGETFINTTNIGGELTRKRILEMVLLGNTILYDGNEYSVDGEPIFGNSIIYGKLYAINNNISTTRKNLFQHTPTDTAEFTIQGNVIELLADYHEINRNTFKPVNALICDNIIRTPNLSDDRIPYLKMRADASFIGKTRIINNIFEGKVGSFVESDVSESYIINQGNVDLH